MATVPPTFANAAANALSGGQAPTPAAPTYQAPAPASEPTFFGRILQGALNGLAGGLRSGQENLAGAGTTGFHPNGNGLGYAEQLQQQQDAQRQQQQAQKVQAAQQDFENQQKTFQANQQAQMQQVQATQAKLNGIHLEQQIQNADETAQNDYYKGQQNQLQSILDGGGKEVAHLKVAAGQSMQDIGASYLKDNPNLMHDPNTHITYSRDADGETEVHVLSGDANAQVDAGHANSMLQSIGSDRKVAPGTSMARHDLNRILSEESGKVADQHNAAKVADIKFQREQALESQRLAGQEHLEKLKEAAAGGSDYDPATPLPKVHEANVDAIASGDLTPAQATKGMGAKASEINKNMAARYEKKYLDPSSPSYNPHAAPWSTLEQQNKYATSDKFSQAMTSAGDLFGTQDATTGKQQTPGSIPQMQATMTRIANKYPAIMKLDATAAQAALKALGDPDAEEAISKAPDIALRYARFASAGGPSSDAQFKSLEGALIKPRTLGALKQAYDGLADVGGNTIAGMRVAGGQYAARRMRDVVDPGTKNVPADSQNPSGVPDSPPKGMKLQRNRKTGATRLVPE